MRVNIIQKDEETITLNHLIKKIKKSPLIGECGAIFSFEGIVRGEEEAKTIQKLELSTPDLDKTQKGLEKIIDEVKVKYAVKEMGVVHYLGIFQPGDSLFLVVVAGAHRQETRAALEEIIERVKFELDFTKEEHGSAGSNIIMSGG